ncbi:hypothetical protein BU16DRAFT_589150 [Lophium mytilinum]|uniref:Uncharacterized protein n=1 Tax=Lophium mytilinum TaxID=390894 RepID=A0A6A6QQC1_9PEZI|nr:hypothetical protein BU16DRAFT_589150 [Lophium mytilinum]
MAGRGVSQVAAKAIAGEVRNLGAGGEGREGRADLAGVLAGAGEGAGEGVGVGAGVDEGGALGVLVALGVPVARVALSSTASPNSEAEEEEIAEEEAAFLQEQLTEIKSRLHSNKADFKQLFLEPPEAESEEELEAEEPSAMVAPAWAQEGFDPATIFAGRTPNKYTRAFETSLHALILAIFEDEKADQARNPFMQLVKKELWVKATMRIIASVHPTVLRELVGGSIAHKYYTKDQEVVQVVDLLESRRGKHPSLYMRVLVNERTGHGPTARDFEGIVHWIRQYTKAGQEGLNIARRMDRAMPNNPHSEQELAEGWRRYLSCDTLEGNKQRRQVKAEWCDNLEARLKAVPEDQKDLPLWPPLQYIGYARNAEARQANHDKHVGSNYLMMMGGGFCHHPPGVNNSSIRDVSEQKWAELHEWTLKFTPYLANLATEAVRFEAYLTQRKAAAVQARDRAQKGMEDSLRLYHAKLLENVASANFQLEVLMQTDLVPRRTPGTGSSRTLSGESAFF